MIKNSWRDEIIKKISEENELFSSYRKLCRAYDILPDPNMEKIFHNRTAVLKDLLQKDPKNE